MRNTSSKFLLALIAASLTLPAKALAQGPSPLVNTLVKEKVSFFKTMDAKGDNWGVIVAKKSGAIDRMEVYSIKKNLGLCAYSAPTMFFNFMNADEVRLGGYDRSLLVTTWTHGAHGETVRVFDPSLGEKALMYEVTSAWPVDYTVDGDHLTIYITDDVSKDDATTVDKTIEWKPSSKSTTKKEPQE